MNMRWLKSLDTLARNGCDGLQNQAGCRAYILCVQRQNSREYATDIYENYKRNSIYNAIYKNATAQEGRTARRPDTNKNNEWADFG